MFNDYYEAQTYFERDILFKRPETRREKRKLDKLIKRIQKHFPPGTRVEVVSLCTRDERELCPEGSKGTVTGVNSEGIIIVDWDDKPKRIETLVNAV